MKKSWIIYLIEEIGTGQPLPVGIIKCPVSIEQVQVKHLGAILPGLPQVAASEEARGWVACQVVDPPLQPQLRHDCVDVWVSGATILPGL